MRRVGHESPAAALRYQHATENRDKALANALVGMAKAATIAELPTVRESLTDERRTKLPVDGDPEVHYHPSDQNAEQSQRGFEPVSPP